MPTPMPDINTLMQTPQFRGPGAPTPAARPPAAAPATAMTALGQLGAAPQAGPSPAGAAGPDIAALLARILAPQGAPPVAAPAPRPPTRSPAAEELIAEALANPEAESKPLYLSADRLDKLGTDADDLGVSLAHLGLHAAPNWNGRHGVLFARSPEILEQAAALKERGEPVPIVPVRPAAPPKKKRGRRPAPARPEGADARSSTAVKPLAPALEEARRDRARQHVRDARSARHYENYGVGRIDWQRNAGSAR